MKQELVQLAKDKGFVATFVHDKPFIYSSKEPLRWLFWMTELQKWLRDIHNLHISMEEYCEVKNGELKWCYDLFNLLDIELISSNYRYSSFEEALESGLSEALKLLKDE